jgi:uncharacterized protein YciI
MTYLIYAIDFEEQDDKREEIRIAHRDHLRSIGNKLLASGALLSEDGRTVIGGISLIDTDNFSEAESFALADPYQKAGIRKELKILKWRKRWWEGQFLLDK